jgi:hypothetical protein
MLHVFRSALLFIIPPLFADFTGVATLVGIVELLIAAWIWSLRIESWGISFGMSLLQILFPMLAWTSPFIHALVLVISASQILMLLKIRREGGYSFLALASVDTAEERKATSIQRNMFNLTVVAQLIKTLFVFLGAVSFLIILGPFEPVPWFGVIPLAPTALLLGLVDLVAGIQLYRGVDWGFHLTLIMAPLSVVETLLTLLQPILLLGIWIAMLVAPCWARDGFYAKLFQRTRSRT